MKRSIPKLPKDFRLGATLCAHATEGEDFASDWWHWEQRPGRIENDDISGNAAGHLNRYEEDAALAERLGLNAILLSPSWARCVPEPGRIDDRALVHYGDVVRAFTGHGVEPFIVLWETAAPQWFAEKGYWRAATAVEDFLAYVRSITDALRGQVNYWIPLASPMEWLNKAYVGQWPGGDGGWRGARKTLRQLVHAHAETVGYLRREQPNAQTGLWLCGARQIPDDENSPWDLRAARGMGGVSSANFMRALRAVEPPGPIADFAVVSSFELRRVRFSPFRPATGFARVTGRTPAPPQSFGTLLKQALPDTCPVFLVRDGEEAASADDQSAAILNHLAGAARSGEEGLDVRGCFCAPLLDGFAWDRGWREDGSLIHVSRETLSRTPNPHAFMLRDIAAAGSINDGIVARHAPAWTPPQWSPDR